MDPLLWLTFGFVAFVIIVGIFPEQFPWLSKRDARQKDK